MSPEPERIVEADRIRKEQVPVVILTEQLRLEGIAHCLPQARLSDFMNRPDILFIPLTNVTVYDHQQVKLYTAKFLCLSKARVILITTRSEMSLYPPM